MKALSEAHFHAVAVICSAHMKSQRALTENGFIWRDWEVGKKEGGLAKAGEIRDPINIPAVAVDTQSTA